MLLLCDCYYKSFTVGFFFFFFFFFISGSLLVFFFFFFFFWERETETETETERERETVVYHFLKWFYKRPMWSSSFSWDITNLALFLYPIHKQLLFLNISLKTETLLKDVFRRSILLCSLFHIVTGCQYMLQYLQSFCCFGNIISFASDAIK